MSKTYEVWSVTTFNRFGQVFTELSEAEAILKQSRESWPDDEFAIVEYGEDRIPRLVGES